MYNMKVNHTSFDISRSIIEHLLSRDNMQDDLSEIALAVYNKEINKLIRASEDGKLSERADDKIFKGDWAKLIKGLNVDF